MSHPSPLIRPRTDADMARITEIYTHHVLHGASSWELSPPDVLEMTKRAAALNEAGYPYLVAEIDGNVAGYAYAGAYRPRPAYRNTVELSIYIDNALRRAGIGRALMESLIDTCTDMGFRQMIAIIGDSQNRQSIEFHEKMGFVHVGKVRDIGFKFGRWMDQIILQRPLGPGASTPPDRP
jgi:L-amino acid N-acyltransferase YncA